MANVNYIRHLTAVFDTFSKDSRLNPTHISIYVALFQFWNFHRFSNKFYINREDLMKTSKIGSKNTYHRCLTNLNDWSYIKYFPTRNPLRSSQVKMLVFGGDCGTSTGTSNIPVVVQVPGQALVPYLNINKQEININKGTLPVNEEDILKFFKEKNWPSNEGKKFFNHYSSVGWKIGKKTRIKNWQTMAEKWMITSDELKNEIKISSSSDHLKTTKNKNYDEPL